jgi:serpin B
MLNGLARRDVLKILGLAALATSSSALVACSDNSGPAIATDPGVVAAQVDREAGDPKLIPGVVDALNHLTGGLYAQLSSQPGNLAFSPYSVAVALSMTRNGAAGKTAEEMDQVLGIGDLAAHNGGINALTQAVEGLAGTFEQEGADPAVIALDSANALFGDGSVTWSDDFLETLARSYGAGMRTVDYIGHTEDARTKINGWTAERTHDKIPEIIPEGVLDELTRLVLVNALYFKAPWQFPFQETLTSDRPFHRSASDTVDVPTMVASLEGAGYGEGEGWRAVRLPYVGGTLAMSVLLPDEGAFGDLEQKVAGGQLAVILGTAVTDAMVELSLPRWKFRTEASLKDALTALGMPIAFSLDADFTDMTDEDADLHIGAVLHQTFVAVDERGTEAAAATAVVMQDESAPAVRVEVVVDRPFLFVIHDVEHLTPLFVGRVADPTA